MQINSVNNIKKYNFPKNNTVNFQGLRQLIDVDDVANFLKKTREIGTVTLQKRVGEGNKQRLKPYEVSVVEFRFGKKDDKKSKIIYSLFEKDYQTASTVDDLDAKELGLVEFKYKNLSNSNAFHSDENEKRSIIAVKKAYKEAIKILKILSYEGDKFKGIGTTLINLVVRKSNEIGTKGNVFLYAENLFNNKYLKKSQYCQTRSGEVPTPFYFNYGFRADETTNKLIEGGNKIDRIIMHLPKEAIKTVLDKIG